MEFQLKLNFMIRPYSSEIQFSFPISSTRILHCLTRPSLSKIDRIFLGPVSSPISTNKQNLLEYGPSTLDSSSSLFIYYNFLLLYYFLRTLATRNTIKLCHNSFTLPFLYDALEYYALCKIEVGVLTLQE